MDVLESGRKRWVDFTTALSRFVDTNLVGISGLEMTVCSRNRVTENGYFLFSQINKGLPFTMAAPAFPQLSLFMELNGPVGLG